LKKTTQRTELDPSKMIHLRTSLLFRSNDIPNPVERIRVVPTHLPKNFLLTALHP